MTTLREIELPCPICFYTFSSQAVLCTNLLGTRTDFHERTEGAQPLPYLIHTCSRCGYTGCEQDFAGDAVLAPVVKDHVWDELAPNLPTGPLSGSEKYEFAAKVATWQG